MDGISLAGTAASPFQGTHGVATGILAVLLLVGGAFCLYKAWRHLCKGPHHDHHPPSHPRHNPGHRKHRKRP
jgi:hypothetical protein